VDDAGRKIRKFQKELNAGAISLVLLGLFSRERKSMYGYEIAKRLEAATDDGLPMNQGALYPVLRSLEKRGFLNSNVEPSVSGPPRKYYRITPDGKKVLDAWTDAWQRTKRFVDSFLESDDEDPIKKPNEQPSSRVPQKTRTRNKKTFRSRS